MPEHWGLATHVAAGKWGTRGTRISIVPVYTVYICVCVCAVVRNKVRKINRKQLNKVLPVIQGNSL